MTRTNRRITLALSVILFSLLAVWTGSASPLNKLTYFKFSGAVAIPGARLDAGEYAFEVANPNSQGNVVLVRDRAQSKVHVVALTRPIHRSVRDSERAAVTLGESRTGEPAPIRAWFPAAETTGYEFIY